MKFIKGLGLIILAVTFSLAAQAVESPAHVIEKNAHDIMKLVKAGKIPADSAIKLHMVQVRQAADGFQLIAILDHNGDHSQTPGHLNFKYDLDAKMQSYEYVQGYVTANATPFTKVSSAKLYDLAAEILMESEIAELKDYANTVHLMELEYDAARNAAEFVMVDTKNKELHVWLDLEGNLLEYKFAN